MTDSKPRIMLLTGGKVHDYRAGAPLIIEALADRFDVVETSKTADLAKLAEGGFAAVVIYTEHREGELTDDLARTLVNFVRNGGGLLGLHSATVTFTDCPAYMELIGARFTDHSPIMDFAVRITDPDNPVVARCDDFRITDELYLLADQAEYEPFAVAHYQGVDRVVGYQRDVGKGRVLYLANGHDVRALGNRHFQRMLERAARLAAGETFDKAVKAGILGYGAAFNMGKHHGESINMQPGMDVTAVCDLDATRTEQAQEDFGGSIKTYNDVSKFMASADFELVIEILPHNLHAEACIAASAAGKHVVSEKPFCVTLDEADRMLAAADKAGTVTTCFHNRRWDGDFLAALHLIRDGAIGEVYRIDAATAGYGEPGTWWRSSKEISGGQMYDWGAHYCDWLLNMANKRIKSITGDFQKRKWHQATNEDYTYALIRFEDDTTATLEQGNLAAIGRAGWRILGTEGGISNPNPGQDLTLVTFDAGRRIEGRVPNRKSNWAGFYQNVGNHLIMAEPLIVTAQQARRAIGVIWLAEQSAKQGGVPLPLPGEDSYNPDYALPW